MTFGRRTRRSCEPSAGRSYPEARPPGNDRIGVDTVDHHELLAAGRAGDDLQVATRDAEIVGEDPQECRIRRAVDGRSHDPDLEHSVDHALDALDRGTRGEADGETDAGETQIVRRRAVGSGTRRPCRTWKESTSQSGSDPWPLLAVRVRRLAVCV